MNLGVLFDDPFEGLTYDQALKLVHAKELDRRGERILANLPPAEDEQILRLSEAESFFYVALWEKKEVLDAEAGELIFSIDGLVRCKCLAGKKRSALQYEGDARRIIKKLLSIDINVERSYSELKADLTKAVRDATESSLFKP